jgi:hypothetical protein
LRPSRKPERAITSRSPFFASLGTNNPLGRHRLHATKQITHQPHPAAVYSRKRANISSSALVPDAAMKRAAAVPTGRYSAAGPYSLFRLYTCVNFIFNLKTNTFALEGFDIF